MTYHPTPEQHRADDIPLGWRGVGHYDTGTIIALCQTESGPMDARWLAATTHQMVCGESPEAAIRALADLAAPELRKCKVPAALARYGAILAAAESLIGYVPRSIAGRRGR
jgi:hypothetical protein